MDFIDSIMFCAVVARAHGDSVGTVCEVAGDVAYAVVAVIVPFLGCVLSLAKSIDACDVTDCGVDETDTATDWGVPSLGCHSEAHEETAVAKVVRGLVYSKATSEIGESVISDNAC